MLWECGTHDALVGCMQNRATHSRAGCIAREISKSPKWLADTRGDSMVEYVILVGVVGLVVAAALVSRGGTALTDYTTSRDLVLVPSL
jgi:Flp pilus assembly pilin Flp